MLNSPWYQEAESPVVLPIKLPVSYSPLWLLAPPLIGVSPTLPPTTSFQKPSRLSGSSICFFPRPGNSFTLATGGILALSQLPLYFVPPLRCVLWRVHTGRFHLTLSIWNYWRYFKADGMLNVLCIKNSNLSCQWEQLAESTNHVRSLSLSMCFDFVHSQCLSNLWIKFVHASFRLAQKQDWISSWIQLKRFAIQIATVAFFILLS